MRILSLCSFLLLLATSAPAADQFLAHNVWIHGGNDGSCINYKTGTILPVGSKIDNIRVVRPDPNADPNDMTNQFKPYIALTLGGKSYEIKFDPDYHPKKTIDDCATALVSDKTLSAGAPGLSTEIQDAIAKGIVVRGMSKSEVLLSYGPPPEHKTPSLDADTWIYWLNKMRSKKICFDDKGLAIDCKEKKSQQL